MSTMSCGRSPHISRYWVCELFIKTLIIMCISINVRRLDVCDEGPIKVMI